MTDLMYEIPSQDDILKVIITKEVVTDGADPVLIRKSEKKPEDDTREAARARKNSGASERPEKEA